MELANKTVLLTGATGGIGSILATLLAREWSDLILVGRNSAKLKKLNANLIGKHRIAAFDLSTGNGRSKLVKSLHDTKIDLLINCAGIGIYKNAELITDSEWYSSYELNVHTPFFLIRDLEPTLTVNIGSCSAVQYHPERTLYNSTKAALRSLTLCLAKENPEQLIHITLDSTMTDFGPLTIEDKKLLQKHGHEYLDPAWVAGKIVEIIKLGSYDPEYVLSPRCFENCGIWQKP